MCVCLVRFCLFGRLVGSLDLCCAVRCLCLCRFSFCVLRRCEILICLVSSSLGLVFLFGVILCWARGLAWFGPMRCSFARVPVIRNRFICLRPRRWRWLTRLSRWRLSVPWRGRTLFAGLAQGPSGRWVDMPRKHLC